jgi:hypothetical protein
LTGADAFDQSQLRAIFRLDIDDYCGALGCSYPHSSQDIGRLHRLFGTSYPAKVADSVFSLRSNRPLSYEQQVLDPRIGFFVQGAHDVSNYHLDRIQSKDVG